MESDLARNRRSLDALHRRQRGARRHHRRRQLRRGARARTAAAILRPREGFRYSGPRAWHAGRRQAQARGSGLPVAGRDRNHATAKSCTATAKPFPGHPKAPFSDAQLEQKLRANAEPVAGKTVTDRIVEGLSTIERIGQCCRVHVASGVRFRGGAEKRGRLPERRRAIVTCVSRPSVWQRAVRRRRRVLTPLGASILRLMISMN